MQMPDSLLSFRYISEFSMRRQYVILIKRTECLFTKMRKNTGKNLYGAL